MSDNDKSPGQTLYEIFRQYADRQACATYSWCGMTDSFRITWQNFAERLLNKTKKTLEDKASDGTRD